MRGLSKNRICLGYFLFFFLIAIIFYNYPTNQAYALPQGGVALGGDVAISAVKDNFMEVKQSSERGIVEWQHFNIKEHEQVNFTAPSVDSITLNRITGAGPSNINGKLTANGNLILINGDGIIFDKAAKVDVGGLLATTSNISNDDFLKKHFQFRAFSATERALAGKNENPNVKIINWGEIKTTREGKVILAAPQIENNNLIKADEGEIDLITDTNYLLNYEKRGFIYLGISVPSGNKTNSDSPKNNITKNEIINHGKISANGGKVRLQLSDVTVPADIANANAPADRDLVTKQVINTDGIIEANTVLHKNGEIYLSAGNEGEIKISGNAKIEAKGRNNGDGGINNAGPTGGKVELQGKRIGLWDQATIDVSGPTAGGEILIGGQFLDKVPARNKIPRSEIYSDKIFISDKVKLMANAATRGHGGRIGIWSNSLTRSWGTLNASGGALGGDGGFIEVSGRRGLDLQGKVELNAKDGLPGHLFIDPWNITISSATDSNINTGGNPWVATGASAIVNNTTVSNALDAGSDVTIEASAGATENGDITVDAPISWITGKKLTLRASRNLTFTANSSVLATHAASSLDLEYNTANTAGTLNIYSSSLNIAGTLNYINAFGGTINNSATSTTVTNLNLSGLTFAGTDVYFNNNLTVNGSLTSGATAYNLRILGGNTTFTLANGLTVAAPGPTTYLGGTITCNGAIFNGAVLLSNNLTLNNSAANDIDFKSTLRDGGGGGGGNYSLTIGNGGGGTAIFEGLVGDGGAANELASLTISGASNISTTGITTRGSQTYTGAVTLGSTTTLTSTSTGTGNITFLQTITGNGARDLTLDTSSGTGTATFSSVIGGGVAGTRINNLTTSGKLNLQQNVTTNGTQTYNGDTTISNSLSLTTTNSAITFGSSLNDSLAHTHTLSLNSGNQAITFNGLVGGTSALSTISATSTSNLAFNGGVLIDTLTINSINDITIKGYNDSVITNATTFTNGGNLTFGGTAAGTDKVTFINGLTANPTGNVYLQGTVKSDASSITFSRPLILNGNTASTVAGFTGNTFSSTVDGSVAGTQSLIVTGNATFGGAVGGTSLLNLSVSGTTNINTASITTTGTQTYTGAVIVSRDTSLTATNSIINFSSTLRDSGIGARTLTLNSGNAAINFMGAVGDGGHPLLNIIPTSGKLNFSAGLTVGTLNLTTLAAGSSVTSTGGNVNIITDLTTTGNNYDLSFSGGSNSNIANVSTNFLNTGIVTLGAAGTSSTDKMTFGAATNFSGPSQIRLCGTIITSAGNLIFGKPVSLISATTLSAAALTQFTSTLSGSASLNITSNSDLGGAVTQLTGLTLGGATAAINTATITTEGPQNYNSSTITIAQDTTITANNNGNINLKTASTLTGAHSLTLATAGTGVTYLYGTIGGIAPPTALIINGAANLQIGASTITTAGPQTYNGACTLGTNVAIDSTDSGANGAITFGATSTINGNKNLTITSGSGAITFNGAVGFTSQLSNLTATTTGGLIFNKGLKVSTLDVTNVTNGLTIKGNPTGVPSVITTAITMPALGILTLGGANATTDSIDFTNGLIALLPAPAVHLMGAVNSSAGAIQLRASILDGNTTISTANGVSFTNTLQGNSDGGESLGITGNATFANVVGGGGKRLASLTVSGTTTINAGTTAITTSGLQTYNGSTSINENTTITTSAAPISFGSTLEDGTISTHNLTLSTTTNGNITFSGKVGGIKPFSSIVLTSSGIVSFNAGLIVGTLNVAGFSGPTFTISGFNNSQITGGGLTLPNTATNWHLGEKSDGTDVLTLAGALDASAALLTINLFGKVTTTAGDITLRKVVLDGNSEVAAFGTNIFSTTIDGAHDLKATGNTTFSGKIGNTTPLTSLLVTGTSLIDTTANTTITTIGTQEYQGAITLSTDATMATTANGDIKLNSTVNGNNSLILSPGGSGRVIQGDIIGGGTSLASLTINGKATLQYNITTANAQSYGATTISGALPITFTTTNQAITFNSTLNDSTNNHTLVLTTGSGNINFIGKAGGVNPLDTITINSTGALNFNSALNVENLTFGGIPSSIFIGNGISSITNAPTFPATPLTLGAVSASDKITFGSAVDLSTPSALTMQGEVATSAGKITLGAATTTLGGNTVVNGAGGVDVNGSIVDGNTSSLEFKGGTTTINGGNITSSSSQKYSGALLLKSSPTLTTTNSNITFSSTVDSDGINARSLTLSSGTGSVSFNGAVGGTAPNYLNTITVTASGAATLGFSKGLQVGTLALGGFTGTSITIAGGVANGAGYIDSHLVNVPAFPNKPLYLGSNPLNDKITFDAAVNLSTPSLLTVCGEVATSAGGITLGAVTLAGKTIFNGAGGTNLGGAITGTVSPNLEFKGGAVVLNSSSSITLTNGPITFTSAVDDSVIDTNSLTLDTGTGAITFTGAVGNGVRLNTITPKTSSTLSFNGGLKVKTLDLTTGPFTGSAITIKGRNDSEITDAAFSFPNIATTITLGGADTDKLTFSGALNIPSTSTNIISINLQGEIATLAGAITLGRPVTLNGATTISGFTQNTFDSIISSGGASSSLTVSNKPTTINTTAITTGLGQTYKGAVSLTKNAILTTTNNGDITFENTSTVDSSGGSYQLTLTPGGTGTAIIQGKIGNTTPLAQLTISGKSNLQNDITTSGQQSYTGASIIGADVTLTTNNNQLIFASTLDSDGINSRTLNLNSGTGAISFAGAVGGTAPNYLNTIAITASGAATLSFSNNLKVGTLNLSSFNGASVTSSSGDFIILTALTTTGNAYDFIVKGSTSNNSSIAGAPTFLNTGKLIIGGANGDTINFPTGVTFGNPLTTGPSEVDLWGTINTGAGFITINQPVVLKGATTLNGFSGTLFNTVLSTINGAKALVIGGNATLVGMVGGITPLTSLQVQNGTNINTTNITTTGAQTYTGAVTLNSATSTLYSSNGDITFNSTIDGNVAGANQLILSLENGTANLNGNIGTNTSLAQLTVNGSSGKSLLKGNITTTGSQLFGGASTLGSSITLTTTNSAINFNSTLNDANANTHTLILTSGSGDITFSRAVGFGNGIVPAPLFAIRSTSSGAANLNFSAGLKASLLDLSLFNGASVTTIGNLTLTSGINNSANNYDITLKGANASTIGGPLNFINLGKVTIGASVADGGIGNGAGGESLTVNGLITATAPSSVHLLGNITTTAGTITLGTVVLDGNTTLAAAGGNIFNSTIDGKVAGSSALTLTGGATFNNQIGNSASLGALTVSGATVINTTAIKTSGTQTYNSATTLSADPTLSTTTGDIIFETTSSLDNGQQLTLTLGGSGVARLKGTVGAGTALTSLTINGASGAAYLKNNVTTTGAQSYGGVTTIAANLTLTSTGGSNIDFISTVNDETANTHTLNINSGAGNITFTGGVGLISKLAAVAPTSSGTLSFNGGLKTTLLSLGAFTGNDITIKGSNSSAISNVGGITFANAGTLTLGGGDTDAIDFTNGLIATVPPAIHLRGNINSTAGSITIGTSLLDGATNIYSSTGTTTLNSTIDNAQSLTLKGAVILAGGANLGGTTPLSALTMENVGSLTINTANPIITTGAQLYKSQVNLGANVTFTTTGGAGSNITFNSLVNGLAFNVIPSTAGTVSFSGGVNINGLDLSSFSGSGLTIFGYNNSLINSALTIPNVATTVTFGTGNTDKITFNGALSVANANVLGVNLRGTVTTLAGDITLGRPITLNGPTTIDAFGTNIINNTISSGGGTSALTISSLVGAKPIAINTTNITTAGAQVYYGPVTVNSNTTFSSSTNNGNITFNSTVNDFAPNTHTLTLDSGSGTINFTDTVGIGNAFNIIKGTSGKINFNSDLTVGTLDLSVLSDGSSVAINNGDANITTALTTGIHNYSITIKNGNGAGGATTVAGNTTFLNTGALTLGTDVSDSVTFTGGLAIGNLASGPSVVNLNGTIATGGAAALAISKPTVINGVTTLNGGTGITLNSSISSGSPTSSLILSAVPTTINTGNTGSILTAGSQIYNGAVTLASSTTLGTTNSDITFNSTLVGSHQLTTSTGSGSTIFTTTVGAGGGANPLSSLVINGKSTLNANITTSGIQYYNGACSLNNNLTLTSSNSNISFSSDVDGGQVLTINSGNGNISFLGAVGNNTALTSILPTATGNSVLTFSAGLNVGTLDLSSFNGSSVISSGIVNITSGMITGNNGYNLTLKGGNGSVIAGATTFYNTGNLTLGGSNSDSIVFTNGLTATIPSTTYVQGSILARANDINFGNTILNGSTTLSATNINLRSSVDSSYLLTAANLNLPNLTIDGNLTVSNSNIGTLNPLDSLSVSGISNLAGKIVTNSYQKYSGAVTITNATDLVSNSDTIKFFNTLDAANSGTYIKFDLDISGKASFSKSVGGLIPLNSLTVRGDVTASSNISTNGSQYYGGNFNLVNNDIQFNGGPLNFVGGINANNQSIVFNGIVGVLRGNDSSGTVLKITNAKNVTNLATINVNDFSQQNGNGLTLLGSSTLIADQISLQTNSTTGAIKTNNLYLNVSSCNLSGSILGMSDAGALRFIHILNNITSGTHFFNGMDLSSIVSMNVDSVISTNDTLVAKRSYATSDTSMVNTTNSSGAAENSSAPVVDHGYISASGLINCKQVPWACSYWRKKKS